MRSISISAARIFRTGWVVYWIAAIGIMMVLLSPLAEVVEARNSAFEFVARPVSYHTGGGRYVTSTDTTAITVRLVSNPGPLLVRPVRCSNLSPFSDWKNIPANHHGVINVATNVRDNTCFRLQFWNGTQSTFNVSGRVNY